MVRQESYQGDLKLRAKEQPRLDQEDDAPGRPAGQQLVKL